MSAVGKKTLAGIESGHCRDPGGMSRNRHSDLFRSDSTQRSLNASDAAILEQKSCDFAVLDDIDATVAGGAGITDGVMPHRASPPLQQSALDGEAGIVVIEKRKKVAHLVTIQELGIASVKAHGVAAADKSIALGIGVIEIEDAALADHGIVVDVQLQALPQFHGEFIEGNVAGKEIVGADDGGVAPHIAEAYESLLQYCNIGNAVLLGDIIGGREAMPSTADDEGIVGFFRLGIAPMGPSSRDCL